MKKILITVFFVSFGVWAWAGSASANSIRTYCQGIVGDSYSLMETCINSENESKRWIESRHTDYKILSYCRGIVGKSYSLTETCIKMEEESKRNLGY